MSERPRLLLLTGHLAQNRVITVMNGMGATAFDWEVQNVGVKVAALMTEDIIRRRLVVPQGISKVIVPGRCRADLAALSAHFGVEFERGPDEVVDLPQHFGRAAKKADLSHYDLKIFAEIVEAAEIGIEAVVERARKYQSGGADVIDIGCLPDTPFKSLEATVQRLKAEGFKVSVDSGSPEDLRRGAAAGADYLLSLNEDTLDIAFSTSAIPVLVPARPGDLDSLIRAAERMEAAGKPYIADPILDPIHFGFAESLTRYHAFRDKFPKAEMMMGTGNLTELTEADTTGMTALLLGICSELNIHHVLVVHVSPHTRRTVEEHDGARRLMYAARHDGGLPKGYGNALLGLHDRRPYANTPEGIAEAAAMVHDRNFRIEVAMDGIHIYNKDMHHVVQEASEAYPLLGVEADGSHAFYLGAELMKAETAFRLGKRYAQDNPLQWGVAADAPAQEDLTKLAEAGTTLKAAQERD